MVLNYNDPKFKSRRRALRRNQTETEKLLWKHLRNKQLTGAKFFRQYSVGPYVLDFYCPMKRLAVELDGGQHLTAQQQRHDIQRTNYLTQQGITVIRFWNNQVFEQTAEVLDTIAEKLNEGAVTPSNFPLT